MILNPNGDMYYSVGADTFYNPLLMAQAVKSTGLNPQFHFFDEILDTYDWSVDYTKSHDWDTLLKERALEIRRKWKKVRVWFSGGRDSYLVLKSFINNGIFIDEIAVINHTYKGCEFPQIWQWLKDNRNLFHADTKIERYDYTESMFYKKLKGNWAENETLTMVSPILTISEIQRFFLNKEYTDGTAEVSGFEKPRVFRDAGGDWYQYYFDADSRYWMGVVDHEPFFISKNVPVFQYNIHHLINYIERVVVPKYNITDYEIINNEFFKNVAWVKKENGIHILSDSLSENSFAATCRFHDDMCRATLRTEFAHWDLGQPLAKSQFIAGNSTRINTKQWAEVEQAWIPELAAKYKDGVMLADSSYEDFFENGDPIYNLKPIHSKYNKIGKYKYD